MVAQEKRVFREDGLRTTYDTASKNTSSASRVARCVWITVCMITTFLRYLVVCQRVENSQNY